jgi:hypothetical protein
MKIFRYKGYDVTINASESGFMWVASQYGKPADECDGFETVDAAGKSSIAAINRDIQKQEVESGDYR